MLFFIAIREKSLLARVTACGMLLALMGCNIPDLRQAAAGPALPADFNGQTSSASSAQLGIAEFFDDPVLTHMVVQALNGNQELKILDQDVQIAANEILARRGAYLPFVFLRGRSGYEKHSLYTPNGAVVDNLDYRPGRSFPDPLPNTLISADVFWQIDIWRELRNARDAASQRYCAAMERRNFFMTQLVTEIAENYYELAALDKRLEFLGQTIGLQEQSLKVAEANMQAGRGTELGVQRFLAEVRKNQSERLIIRQKIIETVNRINFVVGRYPQPVDRESWDFIDLDSHKLSVGLPAQLLQNRRDIRQAEHELAAAGLDILVARAHFYPRLDLTAGVGYEAFGPRYLFNPEAFVANAAGELVAPLINKKAIQADYSTANARQLQAVYEYQRTVLNAFTEVVNLLSKVENYSTSIEIKKEQLKSLQTSVEVASDLFLNLHAEYVEVLLAQRDLLEARTVLVETKQQQLAAIVKAYQALGGGCLLSSTPEGLAALNAPPQEIPPGAPIAPPAPTDADPLPAADRPNQLPRLDGADVPPAPMDAYPLPAPDRANQLPGTGGAVVPPAPGPPLLQPAPSDEDQPPAPGADLSRPLSGRDHAGWDPRFQSSLRFEPSLVENHAALLQSEEEAWREMDRDARSDRGQLVRPASK